MKNKILILFVVSFVMTLCVYNVKAEDDMDKYEAAEETPVETKYGVLEGETGLYYEHIEYEKNSFIEDGETEELDDSTLIVPYFQIEYTTNEYHGLSIGAGLTGYVHLDGELNDIMDGHDYFVLHRLKLNYKISGTNIAIGRQKLEETTLLDDYYEALSLTSEEIKNLLIVFALVDKYGESDPDSFIEYFDVNKGNEDIGDYIYALEAKWSIMPNIIETRIYYYHQKDLYNLIGNHTELHHETDEYGFGINLDLYATDEDSTNGLRDENDEVQDGYIYNINPFFEAYDFTAAAGYIGAAPDVGAREGGPFDDYFNPLNEGDKVYGPDAETLYGSISYETDRFELEMIYGYTDYLADNEHLREEEFNINASVTVLDNLKLEADFTTVKSDSPEGDLNLIEAAIKYEF